MPYYDKEILSGFSTYKYNSIDNSPLSVYVMHPFWNWCVTFCPSWVAPNLLTFTGFLMVIANMLLLCYFDWNFTSSKLGPDIPVWVWWICYFLHTTAHTLDGIDGKQARITKSSTPLGELFDHGVDSLSTVFMPMGIFSAVGRVPGDGSEFTMHYLAWTILITFALSHVEKYNTGVLFLSWGYDAGLLFIGFLYIGTGCFGPRIWDGPFFGLSFNTIVQTVMVSMAVLVSIPMYIYAILSGYAKGTLKHGLLKGAMPIVSTLLLFALCTYWAYFSPNKILSIEPRVFIFMQGVLFSNHVCRIIIAQMTSSDAPFLNPLLFPLAVIIVCVCNLTPILFYERFLLIGFTIFASLVHLHFGVCVVREIAEFLNIYVFSITSKPLKRGL